MAEPDAGPQDHPPLDAETEAQLQGLAWDYVRRDYPEAPDAQQEHYVEQVMRGIRWLQRKWGPQCPCPYCGNTEWAVGVPIDVFRQGNLEEGQAYGRLLSAAHPVVCTNCGNTVLVSQSYAELGDAQQ
jgi:hypothetical protein